jgi:acylphosphatase
MPSQERTARRVTVHGRVQGVFFRDTCRAEAAARGVTGWVSNEPDGTVAAQFEGGPDAVEEMVAWCRTGPPQAQVRQVDVSPVEPTGGTRFEVR